MNPYIVFNCIYSLLCRNSLTENANCVSQTVSKYFRYFLSIMTITMFFLSLVPLASAAAETGPCDIYDAAGTPCVAAHSLTRALYSSYKGVLYTVKKADGTTFDVKVFFDPDIVDDNKAGLLNLHPSLILMAQTMHQVTADGVADSASQVAFNNSMLARIMLISFIIPPHRDAYLNPKSIAQFDFISPNANVMLLQCHFLGAHTSSDMTGQILRQ